MAANPQAAAVIGALNRVIRYAIGLGVGASALQTSLYNGEASLSLAMHVNPLLNAAATPE